MSEQENELLTKKHILVCIDDQLSGLNPIYSKELEYIKTNFCGRVLSNIDSWSEPQNKSSLSDIIVYLTGNIGQNWDAVNNVKPRMILIIRELSYGYDVDCEDYHTISLGEVPINVHNGLGLLFRRLFDKENYFDLIKNAHQFQELTESNKVTNAFRKGLYLSRVNDTGNEIQFNLLRCSSNLNGPTDNFRAIDNYVIDQVNTLCNQFFALPVNLNHVLAQVYENHVVVTDGKISDKKAKIKAHSDKTKDMPREGLICFTSFYEGYSNSKFDLPLVVTSQDDPFDYLYKGNTSILTKLHFRLKNTVKDQSLKKEFDITLYPNSVFVIGLSTNRLYTHEIRPSILPSSLFPKRLGYVIRCSKTKAVFKDNQTYIDENGLRVKLESMTDEDAKKLRATYLKENLTDEMIQYEDTYFSMNNGDYVKPIV